MQYLEKLIITISVFSLVLISSDYIIQGFSQSQTTNIVKNDSWISVRDNLNITISLTPQVPIIDEYTKLSFDIKGLNDPLFIPDLKTKITITDHDGRLYKFENKSLPVTNGKVSVDYIFPDDGEHRIILQLYKNVTPFTVSSFDLSIPHSNPPAQTDKLIKPFTDLFDSIF
jgi:hypothetical protein